MDSEEQNFVQRKNMQKNQSSLWERFFSSRVHFTPSFKDKIFIWGAKKSLP